MMYVSMFLNVQKQENHLLTSRIAALLNMKTYYLDYYTNPIELCITICPKHELSISYAPNKENLPLSDIGSL